MSQNRTPTEPESQALAAALNGDRPALAVALGAFADWQLDALMDGLAVLVETTQRRRRQLELSRPFLRQLEADMARLAKALAQPALAQHSPACLAAQLSRATLRLEYATRWPNFCRACGGFGGFHSTYKPDSGPGHLDDFDTCGACYDTGRCPRCGELLQGDEDCAACGWQAARPDGMPPAADCICDPEMGETKRE